MTVKLREYTTELCPVCPWNETVGPLAVGKNYTVLSVLNLEQDGVVYPVYSLSRINAADPGPGLYWPAAYATVV
jgi:hypothetical protein